MKKTKYSDELISEMFDKHSTYLLRCANGILKDGDEAWEALHFVFEQIIKGKMDSYDFNIKNDSAVLGILRKAIRNHSIDLLRKHHKAITWDSYFDVTSLSDCVADSSDKEGLIDIDSLSKYLLENGSELNYEIFKLYYLKGKNHKEISSILNIKEGTSKKRVHDCNEKIKVWAKNFLLDIEMFLFYSYLPLDMNFC